MRTWNRLARQPDSSTLAKGDPAFCHHFVRVDGVRLHWAEIGESKGRTPLVLLHGLSDCYATWRQTAPRFARDRFVLIPDLPGHGLSARPDASYALSWYARVVARWLAVTGVEQADVVGHSFGGGTVHEARLESDRRRAAARGPRAAQRARRNQ